MDKLSKQQLILIEKYISEQDFSLDALENCISCRKMEIAQYKQDINNIQNAEESKIAALTKFKNTKNNPIQKIVVSDYAREEIQLETELFTQAIEEHINQLTSDIKGLDRIKFVFVNTYKESRSNPTSPRTLLEKSPSRFKKSKSTVSLLASPIRFLKQSREK